MAEGWCVCMRNISYGTWWCLAAILREALLVEVVFYLQVSRLWSAPFCLISRLELLATSSVFIWVLSVYCIAHKWVKSKFFCICVCSLLHNWAKFKCLYKWVCGFLCVCTVAIGAVRYRSMQPYSVSVLLFSLESFLPCSQIIILLLPLWIYPSLLFRMVCVAVCRGKEVVTLRESARK